MSVDKWAYNPETCEGRACPGDCDLCDIPKNPERYGAEKTKRVTVILPEDVDVISVTASGFIFFRVQAKAVEDGTIVDMTKPIIDATVGGGAK